MTKLTSSSVIRAAQTDAKDDSKKNSKDSIDVQQAQRESVTLDSNNPEVKRPAAPLFDFAAGEPGWYTVDDNVMGGNSQSDVQVGAESGLLTFAGKVSLENNGGFASTRSQEASYNLGMFDGIVLRVRGDGKAYRFRVYTEATGRDVAYTAIFETEADSWIEVYIPFSDMVPLYRGFVVNRAGPLNSAQISSFGLMIAEKQQGEFRLEVDWIDVLNSQHSTA